MHTFVGVYFLFQLDIIFIYPIAPQALVPRYGNGVINGDNAVIKQMSVFVAGDTYVVVSFRACLLFPATSRLRHKPERRFEALI